MGKVRRNRGRGRERIGVRRGGWENRRRTGGRAGGRVWGEERTGEREWGEQTRGWGDVWSGACFTLFFSIVFYFEFDFSITNNIKKI